MIIFFISSCKDDNVTQLPQSSPNSSERLKSLYRQKKNPETSLSVRDGGGKLSVNDALDYLNDGMNFLYCRPNDYFKETVIFQDTFSILVSSGEIDEGDLNDLMDDIAEFAGDHYYNDAREKKEPLMFDMNQIGSPSPSYINIEATFIFEADSPLETIDDYPYEDSWLYGQGVLDASEYCSEEEANADAADLFRRDLRKSVVYRSNVSYYYFKKPYIVCYSPGSTCDAEEIPSTYYTLHLNEDHGTGFLLNPEDDFEDDNLFDYLMFANYSGYPNYDPCLSADEMNFYYEKMHDLALDVLPDPVGNEAITQIEVGYLLFAPELESVIFHSMIVVMSTKIVVTEEAYEERIPLPE